MVRRIDAAPDKEHIADAALHQRTEQRINVFFIQHFQKAALFVVAELGKVIRYVVLHGILCRRQQSISQRVPVFQVTEAVSQRVDNLVLKLRAHFPDGNRTGPAASVGIGNIKIVFQSASSGVLLIKDSNASGTTVDPAAKPLIPSFNFQNSGCIRALGVDQQLVIK